MDEKKTDNISKDFSDVTFEDNSEEYRDFKKEKKKKIKNEDIIRDEHIVKKSKKGFVITILVIILLAVSTFMIYRYITADNKTYTLADVYIENQEKDKEVRTEEENTAINNNLGYLNVSGLTVGEWCEENDMTFEKFIEDFCLPENITKDTYYDVAYYMMPVAVIAKSENTDFNTLKDRYKIPDVIEVQILSDDTYSKIKAIFSGPQYKKARIEVNENTPWGIIYDELLVENCIEDSFEVFKGEYGFGDEITPQTKMKEVRPAMEKVKMENKDKKEQIEEQKAEEVVIEEPMVSEEVPPEIPDVPVEEAPVYGETEVVIPAEAAGENIITE